MKFDTLTRRVTVAGAATALAAAGLVAATTTSASATPVTNTYTCGEGSPVGAQNVVLDSDAPGIENYDGLLSAGADAPANVLSVNTTFTITDDFHTTLQAFGVEDLSFPDFAGTFGESTVPVSGITAKVSEMTQNADTTWSGNGTQGLNDAFTAPSGGDHDVLAPADFTINANVGGTDVPVTCTVQGDPGSYATLTVNKNASDLKASSNSPVKKGKKAVIKVKVTAPNHTPTGTVTFKDGKKKIGTVKLSKKGVATLKKKLSKGKHKIKVSYGGDGYTTSGSGKTTVKQK